MGSGLNFFANAIEVTPAAYGSWQDVDCSGSIPAGATGGGVETATTGGTCSTIYAFQMGEGALCGLTGPGHLTVEPIGSLETKDASRTRIKWYCSLALFSSIKAAALIGVKD